MVDGRLCKFLSRPGEPWIHGTPQESDYDEVRRRSVDAQDGSSKYLSKEYRPLLLHNRQ